jgi:3-methylfumaryl-CoA hydratase
MNEVMERTELLVPEPARALGALLDVPVPEVERGEELPLLWHWLYLLDRPRQADLGADGHPVRGTVPAPPEPGRRRMWAGGRVRSTGVLRCGEPATRRSEVTAAQDKHGRSGRLTFVTVRHRIEQRGQVVVEEEQDIVYRDAARAGSSQAVQDDGPVMPPGQDEWSLDISPTLLFRFSALTYNAHRIHYDRDYATQVEGYPGLLTHGPLQVLAMAEAARAAGHTGAAAFAYRLTAPLFDHQGMIVRCRPTEHDTVSTAVRDIHGRQTAHGTLRRIDR